MVATDGETRHIARHADAAANGRVGARPAASRRRDYLRRLRSKHALCRAPDQDSWRPTILLLRFARDDGLRASVRDRRPVRVSAPASNRIRWRWRAYDAVG